MATILKSSNRICNTISRATNPIKIAKGEMTTSNGIEGNNHFTPANSNEKNKAIPKPTLSIQYDNKDDYSTILVLIPEV